MRNQLTVNAAKAAGFKVIAWELDETSNQELLRVEDSKGRGRYFDPLGTPNHAFELMLMLNFSVRIDEAQDRIVVSTDDLFRIGYYLTDDRDPERTLVRKGNVLRELITLLAADFS